MAEIDQTKLNKLVKAGKTHAECAEELGVTLGQLSMLKFGEALFEAGEIPEIPATPKGVMKARDKDGLRWEYIAVGADISVAKTKSLYEEAGGDPKESYIGRGRKAADEEQEAAPAKPAGRGRGRGRAAAKETEPEPTPAATGRGRGRRGQAAAAAPAAPTRNRRRSSRAAASGDPS